MTARAENRDIRPFVGIQDIDGIFDEVTLKVNDQLAKPNLFVATEDFRGMSLEIHTHWNVKVAKLALGILNIDPSEVNFAVYLLGKTLKEVELVRDMPLDKISNPESVISLTSDDSPRILQDNLLGFDVVVALYLRKPRKAMPLTVYEEGTWLAKAEFTVRPERGMSLFAPSSMDAAQKTKLGVPKNTMFYLETLGESMFHTDRVEDVFKFWVDEKVLIELQDERSATAQALAILMVRQALSGLVSKLSSNLRDFNNFDAFLEEFRAGGYDTSVGARLIKTISKKIHSANHEEFLEQTKHKPELVVAKLDDSLNLAKEVLKFVRKDSE